MKILVTGSNGQLGKHLARALSRSSWDHILLTHHDLDISCEQSVIDTISRHSPDVIINAAAFTAVENAETQPKTASAVNAFGPGFLSSAASSINAAIIHLSTDYVFSGEKREPYLEEDPTSPLNTYGASKCAGEQLVINTNPRHIILRTSWVFSEYGTNFFQTMLHIAQARNEISVVNDQFGGPTYAGDLAKAVLKIIGHYQKTGQPSWGTYHYCGQPYVSWAEFAQEIFADSSTTTPSPTILPISSAAYSTRVKRPHNSRLNCAKIKATFGIEPSDWKSAIKILSGKTDENH